jgi:hypothetical protein
MIRVWSALAGAMIVTMVVGLAVLPTPAPAPPASGPPVDAAALEAIVWPRDMVPAKAWRYIVIHHSATNAGTLEAFDQSHRDRGFENGIAYHFIINNGRSEGTGDGQFIQPRALAVSAQDEIFVLDKTRVQKFSADGAFLASWGKSGRGEGQFQNPRGLALDAAGSVYVADSDNHRIQKFEGNGRLVAVWGVKGRELGQFAEPVAVWVSGQGVVTVLEKANERIQFFSVGLPGLER